jgi:hypothetical protein
MSMDSRIARLEASLIPTATEWDALRAHIWEGVPEHFLRHMTHKRIAFSAVALMSEAEGAVYDYGSQEEAQAMMDRALLRLSDHFPDSHEPEDPVALLGWAHAWDVRRDWTPPPQPRVDPLTAEDRG